MLTRRHLFATAPAALALAASTALAQTVDDEAVFWHEQYALLDPAAYEYIAEPNFITEVPAGERWFALNLLTVYLNGKGPYDHRRLDVGHAMPLSPGTVVEIRTVIGFAYICKPSLVPMPSDPRAAYFARLGKLRVLEQHTAGRTIPAFSPTGTLLIETLPSDFDAGMFNHVSARDVSWVTIGGVTNGFGVVSGLNTVEEINNSHVMRFTGDILCPFDRGYWSQIRVLQGSRKGEYAHLSHEPGPGFVTYQKLPEDF